MGGQVLRAFAFALVVGIVVGALQFWYCRTACRRLNKWRGRGWQQARNRSRQQIPGNEGGQPRLAPAGRGRSYVRRNGRIHFGGEVSKPWTILLSSLLRSVCPPSLSNSAHLYRGAAKNHDGHAAGCSTATATATAASDCAYRARETASAFDGCRETGGTESHPEGRKNH